MKCLISGKVPPTVASCVLRWHSERHQIFIDTDALRLQNKRGEVEGEREKERERRVIFALPQLAKGWPREQLPIKLLATTKQPTDPKTGCTHFCI